MVNMVLIENENQLIICMKIFNSIKGSYCNFTIDNAIESFNNKLSGFRFFLIIFNDGEIYYSIYDPYYPTRQIGDVDFTYFIKKYASEYREIRLNEILNVN